MNPLSRTALLPIDVQHGFDFPPWGRRNNAAMESNGRVLLAAWRAHGWPIVHVRHDSVQPGSPLRPDHEGNRFRDGFAPLAGEPVVSKSVNCAFVGTDLELRLRRMKIDTVVLFGIATDMCVSTTARIASNLGFRSIVIGDACLCFDLPDADGAPIPAETVHAVHLATLRAEFAEVADTKTIVHALQTATTVVSTPLNTREMPS